MIGTIETVRMTPLGKFLERSSTKVCTAFNYQRFHEGATILEAREFIEAHMVGETPYGYPVWDEPNSAAQFKGGIDAVDRCPYGFCQKGRPEMLTIQYSVRWTPPDKDGEGSRGGIGGGIKSWHKKDEEGNLTPEIIGWVNF